MFDVKGVASQGTEVALAFEQANARIPVGPVEQALDRPLGRRVVEDDEFEVAMAFEDAPHRAVEVRERVLHGHYDAEEGCAAQATTRAATVTG